MQGSGPDRFPSVCAPSRVCAVGLANPAWGKSRQAHGRKQQGEPGESDRRGARVGGPATPASGPHEEVTWWEVAETLRDPGPPAGTLPMQASGRMRASWHKASGEPWVRFAGPSPAGRGAPARRAGGRWSHLRQRRGVAATVPAAGQTGAGRHGEAFLNEPVCDRGWRHPERPPRGT